MMDDIGERYFDSIREVIEEVIKDEKEKIEELSKVLAKRMENDGLLYIAGCGHSQILAEEVFYRAGELARNAPILDATVSLREGAVKSTSCERLNGYAKIIFDNYSICSKDALLIVSNSGINPVPIELCMEAKRNHVLTIALTSIRYSKEVESRYNNKRLFEIADYVIDNKVPTGDACMDLNLEQKMGPISTIVNSYILHWLTMEIALNMEDPEIWRSSNIEGGDEYNLEYIKKFKNRIKHL